MKIRLSDYVVDCLSRHGIKHVFMVSGGGGMYLIDSLGRRKDIDFVCNHHEQASALAAEGHQRVTGGIGAALVTTGPAGINAMTGVACSWIDSIPVIILSGQANSRSLVGDTGLRQRGVHEINIDRLVSPITKYAVTVLDENKIRYHMEKALYLTIHGRPGPVWIDIPIDIQSKMIDVEAQPGFDPSAEPEHLPPQLPLELVVKAAAALKRAKRPIVLAGHGLRTAGLAKVFINFLKKHRIPAATTKNGFDLVHHDFELLAGLVGTYGQRSGNFAVQNADAILCLGTRLALPTVGYSTDAFARDAVKIVVDVDPIQLAHPNVKIDIPIRAELQDFLPALDKELGNTKLGGGDWRARCKKWRAKYPPVEKPWKEDTKFVNSYYFFEFLSSALKADDIVVPDQGAAFYSSSQAFKLRKGQRLFTNAGFSPMGYGLPAAIGACFGNKRKRIICVHGDGGLQMNIQELQTIVHHRLPIKLFVFNNNGYLSIKHTQTAYFNGFMVGSDPQSGVSCPDTIKIAKAYGIPSMRMANHSEMKKLMRLALAGSGPMVIEVMLNPMQPFEPRVTSLKRPDGRLVSKPLEDMFPFLGRSEFAEEMIVAPLPD